MKSLIKTTLLGVIFSSGSTTFSFSSVIFVDATVDSAALNDGAFVSGFGAGDLRIPSSFSSNFLVQGNETAVSEALPIANIPILSENNGAAFQFIFDSQEVQNTGSGANQNRERIIATEITLYHLTAAEQADAIDDSTQRSAVWQLGVDTQIHLNDATNPAGNTPTNTPLGNGADLSLSIPFSAFPSDASSGDFVFLEVTLTDGNNGNDEWFFAEAYSASSPIQLITFENTPSLNSNLSLASAQIVPEPSTLLLSSVALGLCLRRRRVASF